MKYIQDIENQENLKSLIILDLKELGIKIPKHKKNKTRDDSLELGRRVFGSHLCLMPSVYVEQIGPVPKFLVEASCMLEQHADTEGLFRRSGSLARQKELRQRLEQGEGLRDANPLDVGSVVKQFFRELPDPLFTNRLHDAFVRAYGLEPESLRLRGLMLLCLLLPWHNLCVLRFLMAFLLRLSSHSDVNKMDVLNLAVCLAPNLLYTTSKQDKVSQTESQLLQTQTSIVQMLITNAESIGLVSASLVDRTNLMGSCFPSEDELDRSDSAQNDSKSTKKKKKRSLMSNLSNSFSKWRKDTKQHNASGVSERSAYSFTSVVDKSSLLIPDQPDSLAYLEMLGYPDQTPKMIRKRKAEDEAVPFSASKKQAILQSMPQMSALGGTPFTPATVKRGACPQDFYDTPSIKFSQGEKAVFGATPRLRMDRHLSTPSTASKDKRKSPSKSGCFSPKTPRKGVRRTMRGFLKRLSGGKETQLERSASSGECGTLIDPGSVRKKSLLRKHRKTPSSPARLITPLNEGSPTQGLPVLELECSPGGAHDTPGHERRYSADGTPLGGSSLKRGRPNTLQTGLPSPSHRRSIDRPPHTDPYSSPPPTVECVASTVDTSPILKDSEHSGHLPLDTTDHLPLDATELETSHLAPQHTSLRGQHSAGSLLDQPDHMTHQNSATSLLGDHMTRQHSATSLMSLQESDHDRAFIHESMLSLDPTEEASDMETSDTEGKSESPVFCKPSSPPPPHTAAPQGGKPHTHSSESLDSAIDCSASLRKSPSMQSVESFDSGLSLSQQTRTKTGLRVCKDVKPASSPPTDTQAQADPQTTNAQAHRDRETPSTDLEQSVHEGAVHCDESEESVLLERRPSIRSHSGEHKLRVSRNTHQLLARAGLAGGNEGGTEGTVSEEPTGSSMDVSSHTQSILDTEAVTDTESGAHTQAVADSRTVADTDSVMETQNTAHTQKVVGSQAISDTIADKQTLVGSQAITDTIADTETVAEAVQEISVRKSSPYRFPNSVSRKPSAVSPLRRPDLSKYHRMSPNPRKPRLPLTTNLVNAPSVLQARTQVQADNTAGHTPFRLIGEPNLHLQDPSLPNNPQDPPHKTPLSKGGLFSRQGHVQTPVIKGGMRPDTTRTPLIKAGLRPDTTHTPVIKGSLKQDPDHTPVIRGLSQRHVESHRDRNKTRSPIKPVKRLQVSKPTNAHTTH